MRRLPARSLACRSRRMTTPQDPARRKKQKRRREKQLATWRTKNGATKGAVATKAAEKPEKKAAPAAVAKRPG